MQKRRIWIAGLALSLFFSITSFALWTDRLHIKAELPMLYPAEIVVQEEAADPEREAQELPEDILITLPAQEEAGEETLPDVPEEESESMQDRATEGEGDA